MRHFYPFVISRLKKRSFASNVLKGVLNQISGRSSPLRISVESRVRPEEEHSAPAAIDTEGHSDDCERTQQSLDIAGADGEMLQFSLTEYLLWHELTGASPSGRVDHADDLWIRGLSGN